MVSVFGSPRIEMTPSFLDMFDDTILLKGDNISHWYISFHSHAWLAVDSPRKDQWRGTLMFFFDLRLKKRLSKQSRRRWFETTSHWLWRHRNDIELLAAITSESVAYFPLKIRCSTNKRGNENKWENIITHTRGPVSIDMKSISWNKRRICKHK